MTQEPDTTKPNPDNAAEGSEPQQQPSTNDDDPATHSEPPSSDADTPDAAPEPSDLSDARAGEGGERFTEFARNELRRIEAQVRHLEERIAAIEGDKHLLNLQAESLRMFLGARSGNLELDADVETVADADVAPDMDVSDEEPRQFPGARGFGRVRSSLGSMFVDPVADRFNASRMAPGRRRMRLESLDPDLTLNARSSQRRRAADQSDAIADAAYEVLNEMDDQDMHYHDLTDRVRRKIGDFAGNLNSARVQLNSALNADGRFVRPFRRGRYALRKNFPSLRRSVGERLRPRRKGDDADGGGDRGSGGE